MKRKLLSFLLSVSLPFICSAQAIITNDGLLIGKRSTTGTASVQIRVPKGLLMRDYVIPKGLLLEDLYVRGDYTLEADRIVVGDNVVVQMGTLTLKYTDSVEIDGNINYAAGGKVEFIKQ